MHVKRDIGGAGTGKTTRAIQALERAMDRPEVDRNPFALGFSSFTRAARAEASARAGKAWNMDPSDLEKDGWFKTAHSIAYGALGVQKGEIITGSSDDEKWISEAVQSDVCYQQSDEDGVSVYIGDKTAAAALNYWAVARNTGRPLRDVVESDDTPDRPAYDDVKQRVELYQSAKRLDNRSDFTDLLCRFAGVGWNDDYEPMRVSPEGPVPAGVVGWIFDEAQDATWLLDQACRRIVNTDECKWVMLLGDPWQCQPAGTPVLTKEGYKNIEDLDSEKDWLISYAPSDGIVTGYGKRVRFAKASRVVDSKDMLRIKFSDGTETTCTGNHKWYVRTNAREVYATYIMRRGDRWRIGTVKMFRDTKSSVETNGYFGLKQRLNQEAADEIWVLKTFSTDREARLWEQVVSCRYGIPQVTFRPPCGCKNNLDQEFIDTVFSELGDLEEQACKCLADHGLERLHPFSTKCDRAKNGKHYGRFLQAANLIPGVHSVPKFLPKGQWKESGSMSAGSCIEWVMIESVERIEPGDSVRVFSLEVEKHHTYVTTNGIVTGNCIYGWGGAASKHFMSWEAQQTVMPKSYRCPAPILALGERCLVDLPDYWDRGIAPADHEGTIEEVENYEDALEALDPGSDTLVIVRRNRTVKKVASVLDDLGIPHRSIKSSGEPTQKALGMAGLWSLQRGQGITGQQWGYILDLLPSRSLTGGHAWLVRGSKSQWEKGLAATFDRVYPEDLDRLGATEQLRNVIAGGGWSELVDGGQKWHKAATRFGVDAVTRPKIRIGTIHASKGMEGSIVVLLTSVGQMITEGCENSESRRHEERRLEYVACTRARHKLIVAHDPRERYRMELPL